ncbi:MAG: response regulator [Deltaproteobacteria bacterium]|nr:response regulator [Deltaproteobacteria bacterium]
MSGGKSVLIVDDEPDVRESLAEIFEDAGYSASTAADGDEALRILEHADPCVVLLDLLMPIMNGNEVYAQMQRDPRLAAVPVIVTTSQPSLAPSGLLIMKKPVNVKRLLAAVSQLCS